MCAASVTVSSWILGTAGGCPPRHKVMIHVYLCNYSRPSTAPALSVEQRLPINLCVGFVKSCRNLGYHHSTIFGANAALVTKMFKFASKKAEKTDGDSSAPAAPEKKDDVAKDTSVSGSDEKSAAAEVDAGAKSESKPSDDSAAKQDDKKKSGGWFGGAKKGKSDSTEDAKASTEASATPAADSKPVETPATAATSTAAATTDSKISATSESESAASNVAADISQRLDVTYQLGSNLWKRDTTGSGWNERFVMIKDSMLLYYEKQKGGAMMKWDMHPKGVVSLDCVDVETLRTGPTKALQSAFRISHPSFGTRSMVLCARDDKERDAWVAALIDAKKWCVRGLRGCSRPHPLRGQCKGGAPLRRYGLRLFHLHRNPGALIYPHPANLAPLTSILAPFAPPLFLFLALYLRSLPAAARTAPPSRRWPQWTPSSSDWPTRRPRRAVRARRRPSWPPRPR